MAAAIEVSHLNADPPALMEIYDQNVETVWMSVFLQLQEGSSEIVLKSSTAEFIGGPGINIIAERFGEIIGAEISVLNDNKNGVIRLLPPPSLDPVRIKSTAQNIFEQNGNPTFRKSSAKIAKARMEKVPRPPNAFILYRKFHHETVKANNPGLLNVEISKIIGKMWKHEDEPVKQMFRNQALEIARQHKIDNPNYQYAPRKPSEKQRRSRAQKRHALKATKHSITPTLITEDDIIPDFHQEWDTEIFGDVAKHDYVPGTIGVLGQMLDNHNSNNMDKETLPENKFPIVALKDGEEVRNDKTYREGIMGMDKYFAEATFYEEFLSEDVPDGPFLHDGNNDNSFAFVNSAAERMDSVEQDVIDYGFFDQPPVGSRFINSKDTVQTLALAGADSGTDNNAFVQFFDTDVNVQTNFAV